MSVKQVLNAIGSFDLNLKADTPKDVVTTVTYFGHVAIVPGRIDPRQYGDELLNQARYVGVLREKTIGGDTIAIGGVGMEWHLGDEDTKGEVIETPLVFTASTFANTVRGLLPTSVEEGTLYDVPAATYTGTHQWQTPRDAIQYVCGFFSTLALPVSWRVNGDATLDAGPEEDIFITDPQCIIVRKGVGEDVTIRALPGTFASKIDSEDFTTRVVLLAEGDGTSIYLGEADKDPSLNPYKDIHGNPLVITRVVSESDTSAENANVRAQLALDSFEGNHAELTLSTDDYDVKGSFQVGDRVFVYDPDAELYDTDFEVTFRGERYNPIVLKVTEVDWPVTEAYTVAYRDADGVWTDLTDYVDFESDGASNITVGDFSRQLTTTNFEPIGDRPSIDTSIPGAPVWVEPFQDLNYQDDLGFTRSRVLLSWNAPLNVDGSTVLDGDHYEIQVRVDTDSIYPQTWSSVSSTSWDDANTWDQAFTPDVSDWHTDYVNWGESTAFLNDLATGVGYDVRIRLVDSVGNLGDWQNATFVTSQDNIPPSTPAAPEVAGSRIAVQVTHELGKSTGGTYNLEADLAHLEIHVDYEPHFTPTADTLKGTVIANQGMITATIPAVMSVQVEETSERYVRVIAVDRAGNKSLASDAASATALLIDDAHISDLTVSKVTAGTITADWLMAGRLATSFNNPRVEMNIEGIQAYNGAGTQTVEIDSASGDVTISGTFRTKAENSQSAIVISQSNEVGEIRFYSDDGSTHGRIFSLDEAATGATDASVKMISSFDNTGVASFTGNLESSWVAGRMTPDDDHVYRFAGGGVQATNTSFWGGYSPDPDTFDSGTGFIANATNSRFFFNDNQSDEQGFQLFTGGVAHTGNWYSGMFTANQATFCGTVTFSGVSATSATVTYGMTTTSEFYPLAMIRDDSGKDGLYMTAGGDLSDTSFTFHWATGTNASFGIHFWSFRI